MKDVREEWFDAEKKVKVSFADVTSAAQALVNGHLCGPVAAHYLAESLAAVALLAAETEASEEVVSLQMKCSGPLGGLNVECTGDGGLRGYTDKKVLEDFDGMGKPSDKKVLGDRRIQVTRSLPGRILSQGISTSLDGYLAGSLQRKAVMSVEAAVSDELQVVEARGVLVEEMPDASGTGVLGAKLKSLAVSQRNILGQLGLARAELKKSTPLKFACRCSPERAAAMLAALSDEDRKDLPAAVSVTCHMCGRSFTVTQPQTANAAASCREERQESCG